MSTTKTVLLVSRHAPYGTSLARAALDTVLAAAAFDQAPTLLFMGDGVLQLLPDQDTVGIGTRNHGRVLESLPLYDVERVFVDRAALMQYGIEQAQLPAGAKVLDDEAIRQMMSNHDHILGF